MNVCRTIAIRLALARRRRDLAENGYSTWCAYILRGIAGAERTDLAEEMRVLHERIQRIERGWWRWS